ncbi:MAG: zinc ribbon domain-containing protein [Armatimonadota bacterium]
MPIYEFRCNECDKKFEKLCKVGQNDAACPDCGGESSKLFSAFFARSVSSDGSSCSCGGNCSCGGGCSGSSCSGCCH